MMSARVTDRLLQTSPRWYQTATLALLFSLYLAIPAQAQQDEAEQIEAGVNTPLLQLLRRDDARAVVSKFLPRLVKALDEDLDVQEFLGSSTLLELSIDDDHVINFSEEMLAALGAELAALDS